MTRDRIKEKFDAIREENRPGLLPYLTTGFPDLQATLELIPALAEAGADGIEFSIPFSDPLADGPVIQESSFLALQGGVTPDDCLDLVAQVRDRVPDTPLILMTYYNPPTPMGWPVLPSGWPNAVSMALYPWTCRPRKPGRCTRSAGPATCI